MNWESIKPFAKQVSLKTGEIKEPSNHWKRHLSDMHSMYQDHDEVVRILEAEDPLIYEVYEIAVPERYGHLIQCTSIIYPGKIGREYYMTKGHYHEKKDTAEIYLCLVGSGFLLAQTEEGNSRALRMKSGTSTYIPPFWAHRTVNTGDGPLVFYAVYPADAGHDYGSIEEVGFPHIILEERGKPTIKENPLFQKNE